MICPNYSTPFLLFFSNNVPYLLYYSHIPIFILSITVGIFILIKERKSLLSKALAIPLFLFALWVLFDLITWTSNSSDIITFFWSFFGILFILINFFFLRFLYFYIKNKDIPFYLILTISILSLPIILLTFSSFNLISFDLTLCGSIEGDYFLNYYYFIGILIFIYICFFVINSYSKSLKDQKPKILLMGLGTIFFLFSFFLTGVIVTYLSYFNSVKAYQIEHYGFFPIIIFIILQAYVIVRYKIFNIRLLSFQSLVFGLVFFIGSQFFFIKVPINFVLNSITFVASIIIGYYLIRLVKKEIIQKEHLEKLNIELTGLLKQRESLVHLITHKIKASFTRSKYIFAEMVGGSFGALVPELSHMAQNGLNSDNEGIKTVDLVLNAFNLEKGIVKYDMKETDFKQIVLSSIEPRKSIAEMKGLKLNINIEEGDYFVFGDPLWLSEVTNNLIENSLRYTSHGEITIGLEHKKDKLIFYVKDTGVGVNEEDKKMLFTAGGRGKDSVKVNVDSTGYGLYSVLLIIQAHNGRVWVDSEGDGKGSQFYVELDLAKK